MNNTTDENGGSRSVERMVRHVFSVNVTDDAMAAYIKERAEIHRKGFSGYFRDLVLPDMAKWNATERVRQIALAKLTDEERAALGFDMANVPDDRYPLASGAQPASAGCVTEVPQAWVFGPSAR